MARLPAPGRREPGEGADPRIAGGGDCRDPCRGVSRAVRQRCQTSFVVAEVSSDPDPVRARRQSLVHTRTYLARNETTVFGILSFVHRTAISSARNSRARTTVSSPTLPDTPPTRPCGTLSILHTTLEQPEATWLDSNSRRTGHMHRIWYAIVKDAYAQTPQLPHSYIPSFRHHTNPPP